MHPLNGSLLGPAQSVRDIPWDASLMLSLTSSGEAFRNETKVVGCVVDAVACKRAFVAFMVSFSARALCFKPFTTTASARSFAPNTTQPNAF